MKILPRVQSQNGMIGVDVTGYSLWWDSSSFLEYVLRIQRKRWLQGVDRVIICRAFVKGKKEAWSLSFIPMSILISRFATDPFNNFCYSQTPLPPNNIYSRKSGIVNKGICTENLVTRYSRMSWMDRWRWWCAMAAEDDPNWLWTQPPTIRPSVPNKIPKQFLH